MCKGKQKIDHTKKYFIVFENKEIFLGEEFTKVPEYLLKRYNLVSTEKQNSFIITQQEDSIMLDEEIENSPALFEANNEVESDDIPCDDSFEESNIIHSQEIPTDLDETTIFDPKKKPH